MRYSLLPPEWLSHCFSLIVQYLPDAMRDPQFFIRIPAIFYALEKGDADTFEDVGGLFWLSDVVVGWKATCHIVTWDDKVRKQDAMLTRIIKEIMRLYRLKRLDCYVPEHFQPAVKLAERLGFTLEGVMKKAGAYDQIPRDLAIYALMKGER